MEKYKIRNFLLITLAMLMFIGAVPISNFAEGEPHSDLGLRDDAKKNVDTSGKKESEHQYYTKPNPNKAKPYVEGFLDEILEKVEYGSLGKNKEERNKEFKGEDDWDGKSRPKLISPEWVYYKGKDGKKYTYYGNVLPDGWTQEEMLQVAVSWMGLWYDRIGKGGIYQEQGLVPKPNYGMDYMSPIPSFDVIAKIPVQNKKEYEELGEKYEKLTNGKVKRYPYNFIYKLYMGFRDEGARDFVRNAIPRNAYVKAYDFTKLVKEKNFKDDDKYIDVGATIPIDKMGVNYFKDYMDVVPRGTEFYLIDSSFALPQYSKGDKPIEYRPNITSRNYQIMSWSPKLVLKARSGKYKNNEEEIKDFMFSDNMPNNKTIKTVPDAEKSSEEVFDTIRTVTIDLFDNLDENENDNNKDNTGSMEDITGKQEIGGVLPSFKAKPVGGSLKRTYNTATGKWVTNMVDYAATKYVITPSQYENGSYVGLFENVLSADTIGVNYEHIKDLYYRGNKAIYPIEKLIEFTQKEFEVSLANNKKKDKSQYIIPFSNGSVRGNYITRVQSEHTTSNWTISKNRREVNEMINPMKQASTKAPRAMLDWNFNAYMFIVDDNIEKPIPPVIEQDPPTCKACLDPKYREEHPEACESCDRRANGEDCTNSEYRRNHGEECSRVKMDCSDPTYYRNHMNECFRPDVPGNPYNPGGNGEKEGCKRCNDPTFRRENPQYCNKECKNPNRPSEEVCNLCKVDENFRKENESLCSKCDRKPGPDVKPPVVDTPPNDPKKPKVYLIEKKKDKELKPGTKPSPGVVDTPID